MSWAGAQRPKTRTSDQGPVEGLNNCVDTPKTSPSLGLKLRQQALKLGLPPGSPRWRAYVLGTQAQAEKRKMKKKRKQNTTQNPNENEF